MSDLPFVSYSMSEPQIQLVLAIYEGLKKNYNIAFDPDFSCDLKPFASFDNNDIADTGPFIKFTNPRGVFHLGFFRWAIQSVSEDLDIVNPLVFKPGVL